MGLGVEGVVDRGVVGEESLGWSWQVIGREQIVARSGALDSDIMQARRALEGRDPVSAAAA
jgi:hypothetical protein